MHPAAFKRPYQLVQAHRCGVREVRRGRGLVDGGAVFVPRSATNDHDGAYIIEGIGVRPDIEVENDPASTIAGRGLQLERGVAEVLAAIAAEPRTMPRRPADPVKTLR